VLNTIAFGKTTVTVFSQNLNQKCCIKAGVRLQDFEMFALDYDNDRHFFLSQYFRNKYDSALKNYPLLTVEFKLLE
jgi:cell surface protein SprA